MESRVVVRPALVAHLLHCAQRMAPGFEFRQLTPDGVTPAPSIIRTWAFAPLDTGRILPDVSPQLLACGPALVADALRHALQCWLDDEIDQRALHRWAEKMWSRYYWPEHSPENALSIPIEVLSQLEMMHLRLIGRADVPALLEFLDTPRGEELAGWKRFHHYWERVDYTARERSVEGQLYFGA